MSIVYRVLCGAAAICIGLGLLLGVIGVMTGARPADLYLSPTDLPAFRFVSRGSPIWGRDTVEANYPVGEVQSLDFELQTMNVTIREGGRVPHPGQGCKRQALRHRAKGEHLADPLRHG